MAIQVHAEEVDFTFLKETFGWSKEEVVFSKDLEELCYDLSM